MFLVRRADAAWPISISRPQPFRKCVRRWQRFDAEVQKLRDGVIWLMGKKQIMILWAKLGFGSRFDASE
jgi:hypothetical protein